MTDRAANEHEYEILNETIRHVQNIYFAHLTVFVTVTAGIVTLAFGGIAVPASVAWLAKLFGGLFSLVSWFNAEIYLVRSYRLQLRAAELEIPLEYQHYRRLLKGRMTRFRPGAVSWHLLFGAMLQRIWALPVPTG